MPSQVSKATSQVTSDPVQILNTIRENASPSYAAVVPLIENSGIKSEADRMRTLDSIRNIGTILANMPNLMNEWLNIINRIAFTVVKSANFYNRLKMLKKGYVDYGESIQEIFVNMLNSHTYDINENPANMLATENPNVNETFHIMNYQHYYKVTIYPYELKQAFLTYDGVSDLISKIIKAALTSADLDEYVSTKYLISRTALDGKIYSVYLPQITKDTGSETAKTLIENADLLTYIPSEYNIAKVPNGTPLNRQLIIATANFRAAINVDVLAPAFNMDKTELIGRIIGVDYFTFSDYEQNRLNMLFEKDPNYTPFTASEIAELQTIQALQVSEDWFQIYDNLATQREFENGEMLYRNLWFHFWKTFSISPFENAILYSSTQQGVESISITPSMVTVEGGQTAQLNCNMVTTGFASKQILWEISGDGTEATVSPSGLVKIAANVPGGKEFTVTATSIADSTKSAKATIMVGGE